MFLNAIVIHADGSTTKFEQTLAATVFLFTLVVLFYIGGDIVKPKHIKEPDTERPMLRVMARGLIYASIAMMTGLAAGLANNLL